MSAPPVATTPALRKALYGGLIGSLCGTMGWLVWLFLVAVCTTCWKNTLLGILAVLIGVGVGLVFHWFTHYFEIARQESRASRTDPDANEASAPKANGDSSSRKKANLAVSVGGGATLLFVILFLEVVLHHVLVHAFVPMIACMFTLFPVGAVFAIGFWEPSAYWALAASDSHAASKYFSGAWLGLIIGAVAGALVFAAHCLLGFMDANVGYWMLLGAALGIAYLALGMRLNFDGPFMSCTGIMILFALIFLFGIPRAWPIASPFTRLPFIGPGVSFAVDQALTAPDLPHELWTKFETESEHTTNDCHGAAPPTSHARAGASLRPSSASMTHVAVLDDYSKYYDGSVSGSHSGSRSPLWERLCGCDRPEDYTPLERTILERHQQFCAEMSKGWRSAYVRTLFVLLFFGVGLGLAPAVEQQYRPRDYDASKTRRNDQLLAVFLAVLFGVMCLTVHWIEHTRGNITNSIGMKLALIPAGEFSMGSTETTADLEKSFTLYEGFNNDDERPQHRVRITKPFYLGVYEVTQEQYQKVMDTNPSDYSSTGSGNDAVRGMDTRRFPVDSVSWEEAVEFCRRLSEKEGKHYRLPTEAEWEYACRAGTTTEYYTGNGERDLAEAGWYGALSTPVGNSEKRTNLVGQKRPNGFGLYDMHGNVCEWCNDWYEESDYANAPVNDPQGPSSGSFRVLRGGGWGGIPVFCRSADRARDAPSSRSRIVGFRVALVPSE